MLRPDFTAAARLFEEPPITRFAPSPTGYLHLGHIVNAVYVWGVARALGGSVLVRIEDHDRIRSREKFDVALLEDLQWLGFLESDSSSLVTRQSDRGDVYEQALHQLRATQHVFACDCSRRDIGAERYTGRCRSRTVPERAGVGLRVELEGGIEAFDDLLLGHLEQAPSDQCGDLLIKDRDGQWTYQFAVTVDDLHQGITLVVRGADLVSSTGRQIRLAKMLHGNSDLSNSSRVTYLHHPLVLGDDGEKLSKSTGAASVRAMRHHGLSPAEVIGRAAYAVGLIEAVRPVDSGDVQELFYL
jgi:glutamyl-Q tRNA(Asp) synthetase